MILHILGNTLGSPTFQITHTENFQQIMVNNTKSMCDILPDTQTVTQIYQKFLVARVPFLQLTANILANVNPTNLLAKNLKGYPRTCRGLCVRNGMYAGKPPWPGHVQPRTDRGVILPLATVPNHSIRHNRSAAAT
jgi:hypothetical protein